MKAQIATARIPYEINDKLKLKKGDTVWKLIEIRLTQYVSKNLAEVHLQLLDESNGDTIWRTLDKIEKRIV